MNMPFHASTLEVSLYDNMDKTRDILKILLKLYIKATLRVPMSSHLI